MSEEKTMSTKFRVGDVVQTDMATLGPIERSEPLVPDVWKVGRMWFGEHQMTLLRRPVQVGDVLRSISGRSLFWLDALGGSYSSSRTKATAAPYLTEGRWAVHGVWLDALMHEDGTPIEPPQQTSGNGSPADSQGWNPATTGAVSTTTPARVPEEAGTYDVARNIGDTWRAKYDASERERNRLSDECGALASEVAELERRVGQLTVRLERAEKKR